MKPLRLTKLIIVLAAVGILLPSLSEYIIAEQAEDQSIRFRWAFACLKKQNRDHKLSKVTHGTSLKTGDRLKMYIELQTKCFVYIFYEAPQGKIYMLFPYETELFSADYGISKEYYIPQGDMWFELDENVGTEKFYLLASSQRLNELEALYGQYSSATKLPKQKVLGKEILTKIRELRKQRLDLTTIPERPVQIAGSIRGIEKDKVDNSPDVANVAVQISATDFYSRTFTIDHQ